MKAFKIKALKIKALKIKALLLFAFLLTGCAGPIAMMPSSDMPSSPYTEREDAVGSLLNEAWQALEEGRLDDADSWLSRAMRINPTDPDVYYHMALLRQQRGQPEQARQMAGRALSLGPDRILQRQLNQLLDLLKS